MKKLRLDALALGALMAIVLPAAALAVTPVNSGTVGGATITIDAAAGNQTDPAVSGDLAVYTDEYSGFAGIRFYDFFSGAPGAIVTPAGSIDQLSSVDGSQIAFSRVTGLSRACMVFDVETLATVQIGPSDARAFATALGNDTVAFMSHDDIMVGRLSAPDAPLVNLSLSPLELDMAPAVSPSGDAVVWQECDSPSTTCRVLKSTLAGGVWGAATEIAPESVSPDTDGTLIAYDSWRAGSVNVDDDIYFQALGGGAETRLSIDGLQRNPSISQGVIAFESTAPGNQSADLFVYEVSTNRLYQVTDTPGLDELLNDITVLANGDVRVVWAAHPDSSSDNDIYARTFTLPAANAPPTANAGPDQAVHAGIPVQLDGSGSFDDNTPKTALKYQWSFASIPGGSSVPVLSNATSAAPSFTPSAAGSYIAQLIVTDDATPPLSSDPAYVTLSSFNQAPTAIISATPTIPFVGQMVALDGSQSLDPDHDPISYDWTISARPPGSTAPVLHDTSPLARFTPDLPGTYRVTLTVSDLLGPGEPASVGLVASSAASYAEFQILQACALVQGLPSSQVTSKGNQKAFCRLLRQAVRAIQNRHYCRANEKLTRAILRTDGFPLRGVLDKKGDGRDWITDATAQRTVYAELSAAQAALAGLPCGSDPGCADGEDDDGD